MLYEVITHLFLETLHVLERLIDTGESQIGYLIQIAQFFQDQFADFVITSYSIHYTKLYEMKLFGIKAYRRRGRRWKKPRKTKESYPNLLLSNYPAYSNHIWVTDFTYIPFQGKTVYLATVMDLFTRKIVGMSVYTTHATQLVLSRNNFV